MNEKVVSGRVKRDRIGAVEAHVAVILALPSTLRKCSIVLDLNFSSNKWCKKFIYKDF